MLRKPSMFGVMVLMSVSGITTVALSQGLVANRCAVSCSTFTDYESADPLCIIDPTCLSPFFRSTTYTVQPFTGAAYYRLGMDRDYPAPVKTFAIPNFILFLLTAIVFVVAGERLIRSASSRYLARLAIFSYCTASAIGWSAYLWSPPWEGTPDRAVLVEISVILILALSLVAAAIHFAQRRHEIV
jgi:hypothetical protein